MPIRERLKGILHKQHVYNKKGILLKSHDTRISTAGSFFLPGLIWGRTVFCIDIANSTRIHMVKLHLPHMYMIFVDNFTQKNNPNLIYNTSELFNTFRIRHEPLKPFVSNSLDLFQLLRHFLLLFVASTVEYFKSFAPSRESYYQLPHHFFSRPIMVVELNKNYL